MASGIAGNLVNCTWRFLIAGVFFKFICQRNNKVYWFYYAELPFHLETGFLLEIITIYNTIKV